MRALVLVRSLIAGLALMLVVNGGVEAQEPAGMQAADSTAQLDAAVEAADVVTTTAARPTQGLPRRAPQPRTLHEFWPAFAVLALLWLGMVVYVVPMGGPLRRIAERIGASENRTGGR